MLLHLNNDRKKINKQCLQQLLIIISLVGWMAVDQFVTADNESTDLSGVAKINLPSPQTDSALRLWYDRPARNWQSEALPIGNGYLGAMFFGDPLTEHIQYNEKTLWTGGPGEDADYNAGIINGAAKQLEKIRQLIRQEKFIEANYLKQRYFIGKRKAFGAYQSFADVFIHFANIDKSKISQYRRELDLKQGMGHVSFISQGVKHTRNYFASYPDKVLVLHFTASEKGKINFSISQNSEHKGARISVDDRTIILTGSLDNNGMRYESRLGIQQRSGKYETINTTVRVTDADEAWLVLSAATDYSLSHPDYITQDPGALNQARIEAITGLSYEELKNRHLSDYRELFARVSLQLEGVNHDQLPTDKRMVRYAKGETDSGLEALYFQYGRYLLISASRSGSLPANLQGIWNDKTNPPWNSDYHLNINLQMNYWPAGSTNLAETFTPLVDLVANLQQAGTRTAQAYYGIDQGWVSHLATNAWGHTAPGAGPKSGLFIGSNAWLANQLWDHYLFTLNKNFLSEKVYPIMKGAAEFWLAFLHENDQGQLLSSPSTSPENTFQLPDDILEKQNYYLRPDLGIAGEQFLKTGLVSEGTAMDQQLVWELFGNMVKAMEILDCDPTLYDKIVQARNRLPTIRIGRHGQVQEWLQGDWDQPADQHRHVSHLYALHPGKQISPLTTPELAQAAATTLTFRGDGGTGWSRAWKINFWARLLNGNHAYSMLRQHLQLTNSVVTDYQNSGGTYANLFDAHPPFQVDGNFGGTAGIAEMLLQSHLDEIILLPALPDAWPQGQVTGLKARGGVEVSIKWRHQRLESFTLKSMRHTSGQLRYRDNVIGYTIPAGNTLSYNDRLVPISR